MKTIAIVQARLSSTRLANKILLDLLPGKTVLECMINRVKRAKNIDKIIIATTENPKDKKLVNFLKTIKQPYFIGSEDDVLERYYKAALKYCADENDIIVRLTSDCPVIDPKIIDEVIQRYLDNNYDFASNVLEPCSFPDGMDVEVFSLKNLKKAQQEATLPSHREHVTFYFWQNPDIFKIYYYQHKKNLSPYRLTLDYQEDYQLLKKIYEHFYNKNNNFTMEDIIKFLDKNPAIKQINAEVVKNAGWQPALKKDQEMRKLNNPAHKK